jgi:hypothetical protein
MGGEIIGPIAFVFFLTVTFIWNAFVKNRLIAILGSIATALIMVQVLFYIIDGKFEFASAPEYMVLVVCSVIFSLLTSIPFQGKRRKP